MKNAQKIFIRKPPYGKELLGYVRGRWEDNITKCTALFLLCDSPALELYVPTFRNIQNVPKRRNIQFRLREITKTEE